MSLVNAAPGPPTPNELRNDKDSIPPWLLSQANAHSTHNVRMLSASCPAVAERGAAERAVELTLISGRSAQDVSKSDLERAKRELTGEPDADPNDAVLEAVPESGRWDPVPGSTGHKAPAAPSDDEDDEGRSDGERLVEEGIAGAEHDQMLQAARDAAKQDE